MLGGAGNDLLGLLQGDDATETTGTIAEVSGFEEIIVFGGSWTMLDAQSYANGAYVAGAAELVLGGNGTLDAAATVDGRLVVDHADEIRGLFCVIGEALGDEIVRLAHAVPAGQSTHCGSSVLVRQASGTGNVGRDALHHAAQCLAGTDFDELVALELTRQGDNRCRPSHR